MPQRCILLLVVPKKPSIVTDYAWKQNTDAIAESVKKYAKVIRQEISTVKQWQDLPALIRALYKRPHSGGRRRIFTVVMLHASNRRVAEPGCIPRHMYYPVLSDIMQSTTMLYPNAPAIDLCLSFKYYYRNLETVWRDSVPHIPTVFVDTTPFARWDDLPRKFDALLAPATSLAAAALQQLDVFLHSPVTHRTFCSSDAVVLKIGGGWGALDVCVVKRDGLAATIARAILNLAWPVTLVVQPLVQFLQEIRVYYVNHRYRHWAVIGQTVPKPTELPVKIRLFYKKNTGRIADDQLDRLAAVASDHQHAAPILEHFRLMNGGKTVPLLRIDWFVLPNMELVFNEVEGWGADILQDPLRDVIADVNHALVEPIRASGDSIVYVDGTRCLAESQLT